MGKATAGKTTVSRLLSSELLKLGRRTRVKAFGSKIYDMCYAALGMDRDYMSESEFKSVIVYGGLTGRQFMILVATKMREIDNSFFVNLTMEWGDCIYSDMRDPVEYKAVREREGIFIRVKRDNLVKVDHPNESYLDSYEIDYEIDNNGTLKELEIKVKEISQQIMKKYE